MKQYIVGNIRKIIFESNSGPFKIGLFKVKETNDSDCEIYVNKIIGFTGNFTEINEDVDYILYGKLYDHPKYGIQYNVDFYELKAPSDEDGLILYLSSGMFKGIGEKTAKKIVERFGNKTLDIIRNNVEELSTVSGMTLTKAKRMHDKVVNSEFNQDIILKLNSLGFSVKEAIDLITIYNSRIPSIIENNIYDLVEHVSFDKLDLIFLRDHDEEDYRRVEALILHNIYSICFETGDTLVEKDELFIRLKKCFNKTFNADTFIAYINKLLQVSKIIEVEGLITLTNFYLTEKSILTDINRLNSIKEVLDKNKIKMYISTYEEEHNITFNKEQTEAIENAITNNFYIVTGGPGTGKTTIIKAIVDITKKIHKYKNQDIALLAPTGRSAKRMSESVGVNAYTIHKYLKWNKETGKFQVDEFNKTRERIVIVDEASMIDIFLFSSLLKGLSLNVKLLLIGDANQLPSIGPGDILNDLINNKSIKSKKLQTIYRVKEGSYLTYLANDIKNRVEFESFDNSYDDFRFIESSDDYIKLYLSEICNKIKDKGISIENFQVLAPMYKGDNGIDKLNDLMAEIFNSENEKVQIGDKHYRINDKVIQLVNDVENNVFNGDIGYITDIYHIDKKLYVSIDFMGNTVVYKSGEFDKFTLAYAISIHKSQGSEYDNVVVILAKSFKKMFYNKLIYTACTRAKSSLIIIGSINSLNSSVQTLYANNRKTYLKYV